MIVSIIHSGLLPLSRNASTTLRRFAIFLRLASRGDLAHLGAQRLGELDDVELLEQLEDRLGAHAGVERVVAHLVEELAVALLGEELARRQARLLRVR